MWKVDVDSEATLYSEAKSVIVVAPSARMKGKVKSQKRNLKRRGKKKDSAAPAMKTGVKPKYQEMARPASVASIVLFSCAGGEAVEAECSDAAHEVDGAEGDWNGRVLDASYPSVQAEGPRVYHPPDGEGPGSEEEGVDWEDDGGEEELR